MLFIVVVYFSVVSFHWCHFAHHSFLVSHRSMPKLRVLRLFGNPLEFLPEILPLHNLRHLTLANIRIEALESLKSVTVQIEVDKLSWHSIILLARPYNY